MANPVGRPWQLADRGDGRGDMLTQELAWGLIPAQFISAVPETISGLKATYLTDESGSAVVSVQDALGGNLVASGAVTYNDALDELTVNVDPAGQSVQLVADTGVLIATFMLIES